MFSDIRLDQLVRRLQRQIRRARDEGAVGHFNELADGTALHAKYDVIRLASFENFEKVFELAAAQGLKQAVTAGTGFIHTAANPAIRAGRRTGRCLNSPP